MSQIFPARRAPVVAAGLVALLTLPAVVSAQLPGTLFGLVEDENGDPVPDATLTLTDPESPSFEHTETTDDKGRYNLFVANAVKPYTLTISKDGYQPVTLNGVKISARQRTRRNFTLQSASAAIEGSPELADQAAASGAADLFNRAVTAINVEDYDSAESLLHQALEENSELRQANAALARIHLHREEWEKAVEQARIALDAEVDTGAMNQVLYASYTGLGKEEEAQEILAKMGADDPSTASSNLFNQAADLYNTGDSAGAKPILQQVLELDPEHPKANYMMGLIYAGEQVNDKARMHLEKFIEVAPDDPDAALAKEMLAYLE